VGNGHRLSDEFFHIPDGSGTPPLNTFPTPQNERAYGKVVEEVACVEGSEGFSEKRGPES
jgi:hypothetical protein